MPQINSSRRITKTKSSFEVSSNIGRINIEFLPIVKTYPSPSTRHQETVCIAGLTKDREWIRVYPVPFRYLSYYKKFRKYQWITADLTKTTKKQDFRPESYRVDADSIEKGIFWDTRKNDKGWVKRKRLILPTAYYSMEEISGKYSRDNTSLGIFKPREIDFKVDPDNKDWGAKQEKVLRQLKLFGNQPKKLEKVPFKFSYQFRCEGSKCKGHTMSIHDWEIFELYRNLRDRYGYAIDEILEKIKQRWLDSMWSEKNDTYLIVGSVYPKPTFIVLGVFYPPK